MGRAVVLIAALLGSPRGAGAQIVFLDPTANVMSASVTTGADGLGLIAYLDESPGSLKVAHCMDVVCAGATLSTLAVSVGGAVSITTGLDGLGLIAYFDATMGETRVAHCSDAACTSATSSPIATGSPDEIAVAGDGFALVSIRDPALKIAHCQDAACTTASVAPLPGCANPGASSVTRGADGLALVACVSFSGYPERVFVTHCDSLDCAAPIVTNVFSIIGEIRGPHLLRGADDLGLLTADIYDFSGPSHSVRIAHCEDPDCSSVNQEVVAFAETSFPMIRAQGLPLVLMEMTTGQVRALDCADAECSGSTAAPTILPPAIQSVALASDDVPLIVLKYGGLAVAHCLNATCDPLTADVGTTVTDGVATAVPGHGATYTIVVSNSGPGNALGVHVTDALPLTLVDATWTCSATPGSTCPPGGTGGIDHTVDVAALGTLTYALTAIVDGAATGSLDNTVSALVAASYTDPAPGNNSATDVDSLDGPVSVNVADNSAAEAAGNALFQLSLSRDSQQSVTVGWTTTPGTATPGADYLPGSGSLTFAPGATTASVGVPVVGDYALELAEDFGLQLSAPEHAVVGTGKATATILDDDMPHNELVHGSVRLGSLTAWPGAIEDRDYYFVSTPPHASWEVMVDSTSADVVPILVERLDSGTLATLQVAGSAAGGSSVDLRWENPTGLPTSEIVAVHSGGCVADCGLGAVYRIRARETTSAIPRFNNSAGQLTLVLIQNATSVDVQARLWFWSIAGSLLVEHPLSLGPRASSVLDTTSLDLAGQQGSITLSHDGPYGALAGKATSLEPASGFVFDTAMVSRTP